MSNFENKLKESIPQESEPEVVACTMFIDPITRKKELDCVTMPNLPEAKGHVIQLSGPVESVPEIDRSVGTKI